MLKLMGSKHSLFLFAIKDLLLEVSESTFRKDFALASFYHERVGAPEHIEGETFSRCGRVAIHAAKFQRITVTSVSFTGVTRLDSRLDSNSKTDSLTFDHLI
jgi:hypothetical protein